jgi:hypothetical protein
MRNGSYRKPYDKVYQRLQSILGRMEFSVIDGSLKSGTITAKRNGTLFYAAIMVELTVKVIDENSTQVFIKASGLKHWFAASEHKLMKIEERILHTIS